MKIAITAASGNIGKAIVNLDNVSIKIREFKRIIYIILTVNFP